MKVQLYCKNTESYIEVNGGVTLADIARQLAERLPFQPICCRVNNKTEPLDFPVYTPKQIEFLPCTEGSGPRVYLRSLCFMLYRAVCSLMPGTKLRIEHSICHGYYCLLEGHDHVAPETVAAIKEKMLNLHRANLPIIHNQGLTRDVLQLFAAQGLDAKVRLMRSNRELYTRYMVLDGVYGSYYGAPAPATGYIGVFDLVPYKHGFLLMSFDPANPAQPSAYTPQEKMYNAFEKYKKFNGITGVRNVGDLNECTIHKQAHSLINLVEALHDKALANISDEIKERYDQGGARIVLISGPSSSGKTTTTKRLAIQLMTNLLKPQMISLDDYFVSRNNTPRDASGDYDYESLYALDLEQFNADLNAILAGEEVELPTYNFQTGEREYKGKRLRMGEGSILLIEGIHGLNPELTRHIPEKMKYRLYVSALTTLNIDDHNWISSSDNRLLRRIVRDYKYRGTNAESTIRRWPSVRRGEEKWIFPYQENADAMFNSSLIYELAVMKDEAENVLRAVPADVPEYAEAYRLCRFLRYFIPIDSACIPSTSLLREFLGGSSFSYD